MKKWLLMASTDGEQVDFEAAIFSEKKPSFWTCQDLAEAHGCALWRIEEAQQ